MPVEQILSLVTALVTALAPLIVKLVTAGPGGAADVLARESVAEILGPVSRLELAEQAAQLRAAHAAGATLALDAAQRALVDLVLTAHDALAVAGA